MGCGIEGPAGKNLLNIYMLLAMAHFLHFLNVLLCDCMKNWMEFNIFFVPLLKVCE